ESGPTTADLVRDVDRMALANEVLVPAHSAIRCRLPRLSGQRRAVDHDDGTAAFATARHHVAHVHLVDGDVPPAPELAQLAVRLERLANFATKRGPIKRSTCRFRQAPPVRSLYHCGHESPAPASSSQPTSCPKD